MGGAAVVPPLLTVTLGIDQHRAQGISLAALLPPVGLPAVLAYRRAGVRLDVRLLLALIGGFICGAPFGAWLAHRVASRELRWAFAAFLVATAWRSGLGPTRSSTSATGSPRESGDEPGERRRRPWAGVPIGFVAGAMSGLLGVGGGFIALPLVRRFAGQSRLESQATALAMLLPPIALPAVLVYAREQRGLPWPLLVTMAVGFALGAAIGGSVAGRINERTARVLYAALLVVIAAVLVLHP
jgi:uncharacterized membrane protein YfcA